jgi:hypothetical protein
MKRPQAVAALLLLSVGGCGAETAQHSGDGGAIAGLVTLGPIMPVCREGVPCDGVYKGAKVLIRDKNGKAATRVVADDNGEFRAEVPAGAYTVEIEVGNMLPSCSSATAMVVVRETVSVKIDCDSGIR